MLEKLLDLFRSIPAPMVIGAAWLFPALETALLLGALVPGELIVIAAGIRAAHGSVPVSAVIAASAVGAIVGDSIGYSIGRRFRGQINRKRFARRWDRAERWLKKKGKPSIFLGRFTPFARSVMPPAAGASRVKYRDFLLWNVPAGLLWGTGSTLVGYYAALHSSDVLSWASVVGVVLLAATIVAVVAYVRRRRRRRAARTSRAKTA